MNENELMEKVDEFWDSILRHRPRYQIRYVISRLMERLIDLEISETKEKRTAGRGAPEPLSVDLTNTDKKERQ